MMIALFLGLAPKQYNPLYYFQAPPPAPPPLSSFSATLTKFTTGVMAMAKELLMAKELMDFTLVYHSVVALALLYVVCKSMGDPEAPVEPKKPPVEPKKPPPIGPIKAPAKTPLAEVKPANGTAPAGTGTGANPKARPDSPKANRSIDDALQASVGEGAQYSSPKKLEAN